MKKKKYRLFAVVMALLLIFTNAPIRVYASTTPSGSDVLAKNNAGLADTITVSNLLPGDVVKVYVTTYAPTETPKATGTVPTGGSSITLSYAQFDPGEDGENIYITVTSTGSTESTPLLVALSAPGGSGSLDPGQVDITNNSGTPDTLEVTNTATGAVLSNGDIIKVYSGPSGNAIAVGYYSSATGKALVGLAQLLNASTGGSLYVSLIKTGLKESARVEVAYDKELTSGVLINTQVTITNNALIADTVKVTGLTEGDTIKVYRDASSTTALGSSKAVKQSDNTYAVSVIVTIAGTDAGSLAVSLTNLGKLEGAKTLFTYAAVPKSSALDPSYVTIKNLSVLKDTITVTNISAGDTIKVYRSGSTLPIGSATVLTGKTEATVSISQLGIDAGIVYITYTKLGYTESESVEKTYPAEEQSGSIVAGNIEVTNNFELPDIIKVTNLVAGDVVKLYRLADSNTAFATATVAAGKTEVTISTTQLGISSGSFFVTITSLGKLESSTVQKSFSAEVYSTSPTDITISNNTGKADTILVKGLTANDRVFMYRDSTATTAMASSTVLQSSTAVTLSITQLGVDADSVYISVKSTGKMESPRTKGDYLAEVVTDGSGLSISVKNYSGLPDIITISGVVSGQIVKVYADALTTTPLVVSAANSTTMNATYGQLGTGVGSIWVSVTTSGSRESVRVQKTYDAEIITTALAATDVVVVNHTGRVDTITVTATPNANIFVYRDNTIKTSLARGTVSATGSVTVTYPNLGDTAGDIYVSVANKTEAESTRTKVSYSAALTTAAPTTNVSVANNSGKSDSITITDLLPGDLIRVYRDNSASTKSPILQAYFPMNGSTTTLFYTQLGQGAGSIYVSIQSPDMLESTRAKVDYVAEKDSTPPVVGNIIIINNPGMDFILVKELTEGDTVKVYSASGTAIPIATAFVATKCTYATFSLKQLGASGGSIAVTVTNSNCLESTKTTVTFGAE